MVATLAPASRASCTKSFAPACSQIRSALKHREPAHSLSCIASSMERGLACEGPLFQEPLLGLMKCRHCCAEAVYALMRLWGVKGPVMVTRLF